MVINNQREEIFLGDVISFKDLDRLYRIARLRANAYLSDAYFEGHAREKILSLAYANEDFFDEGLPGTRVLDTVANTLERLVNEHNATKNGGSNE